MLAQVLVVGAGSIGERHIRCFQSTGRVHVAFVEVNEPLRRTIAERYNVVGYESLESALKQPASESDICKLAVIATPAHLHIANAKLLAQANYHMLIEKPLSTSVEEVASLQQMVIERRLVVGVAYVLRCSPALAGMRAALLSGRFGKPVQITAVSGQNFPTYRPAYRSTYYTRRSTGGGAIQDALTHVLNAAEWLVGPIDHLIADAAHQILDGVEVEDTAHVLARHGNVLGSYSLNQYQAPNEGFITVVCTNGTVRWESHAQSWRWMLKPEEPWQIEPFEPLPRDANFIHQANSFIDAIERSTPPLCTLAEGAQTLKVNIAALASLESKHWQQV